MGAFLVANRDIDAGDEILIDYGSTYWKNAEHDSRKRK
jgi:SET domain-containing protein